MDLRVDGHAGAIRIPPTLQARSDAPIRAGDCWLIFSLLRSNSFLLLQNVDYASQRPPLNDRYKNSRIGARQAGNRRFSAQCDGV